MHDCLKPAYIRTLPSLQQLLRANMRAPARAPTALGRVPVYYRALQHPPNLADPVEPESRLAAAHFSLVAISRLFNSVDIIVPIGALESLWLRIWPWIQYIQAGHHTHPRDPHDAAESALCVSLILFFWTPPSKSFSQLHPTPTRRIWIAFALALPRCSSPQNLKWLLNSSAISLTVLAGPRSLALLIASLLTRICPRLDVSPAPINIQSVGRIIEFLGATTSTGGASDEGFTQALGQRRPITAMTNALRSLTLTPTSTNAVAAPFGLLLHLLTITPSSGLRRSLQSGLLTAVFACGRRHMATTRQFIFQFFTNVLSPATVFHSVLLQLKISSDALVATDTTSISSHRDLHEAWRTVCRLLSFRLNLVNPERSRPCDNTNCSRTAADVDLQRCAKCAVSRYCSRACQRQAWNGEHRELCKLLRICHRPPVLMLSPKDRTFLRALLIHESVAHRAKIDHEYQAVASKWSLDRAVPCTVFDFRSGLVNIQVLPLLAIVPGIDHPTARTVASSGYRLFVLKLADGHQDHMWVYPVRSP
ncbi:hypothetical protein B0H14DRAFT_3458987 [Mycena olivaceomarginata]|nr:hypothetical protein B0H14DRAFT_3458987 [Mycena olivaceomarginata]